MPSYRYPGPRPFEENDINLFFGREKDKKNLLTFINVEPLLVLFAKSGLGKSSLVNAAIIPELRKKNYEIILCRFNSYVNKERDENIGFEPQSPLQKIYIETSGKLKTQETFLDKIITKPEQFSLWHQFKNLQISAGEKKTYFIFFDQFEELFTYPQAQVKEFKEHLAEILSSSIPQEYLDQINAVENDASKADLTDEQLDVLYEPIPVKMLCTIRSDKFSLLTNLKDAIPGIITKTYELKPFNKEEATDAIVKPASLESSVEGGFVSNTFTYEDDAIKKMLDYLSDNGTEDIESFQLQVLCRYVEDIVIENKNGGTELKTINANQLGDIKNIFEAYYNRLINGIDKDKVNNVKRLFEEGLIFEKDKIRVPLYKGQIADSYGVDEALLQKLVNTHLIRSEADTNGKERFELSHDSLIEPILKAKEKRVAEEKAALQKIKFKKRVRLFAVVIISVVLIFGTAVYFFSRNSKKDKLEINFLVAQKDWFYLLDSTQRTDAMKNNFLFLINKDSVKYNALRYSFKCAAFANQNAEANYSLALKFAQEGFLKDSGNPVIQRSFNKLIRKPNVHLPLLTINCSGLVNNARVTEDQSTVIAATTQGIFWYNAKNGAVTDSLTDEKYVSNYSVFSPDGNYLLYQSYYSDSASLLNIATKENKNVKIIDDLQYYPAFDIEKNNEFLIYANAETVNVISLNGVLQKKYTLPISVNDDITVVSLSPDNDRFVVGTSYGEVFSGDLKSSSDKNNPLLLTTLTDKKNPHYESVNTVSFSHNGKYFITGFSDGKLQVWNSEKNSVLQTLNAASSVSNARFSQDDNHILIGETGSGMITQWSRQKQNTADTASINNRNMQTDSLKFTKDVLQLFGLDSSIASINFYNSNSKIIAASNNKISLWNLHLDKKFPLKINNIIAMKLIPKFSMNDKIKLRLVTLEDMLTLTQPRQIYESIKMLNDSLTALNTQNLLKENRQTFIELCNIIPKLYNNLNGLKEDVYNKLDKLDSFDIYIYTGNSYFYKILLDKDSLNGNFSKYDFEKLIAFRQAPFKLDTMYKKCFDDLFSSYSIGISSYFKNKQYNSALYWNNKIIADNPQLKNIEEIKNDLTIVNQYDVSFRILKGDIEGAKQAFKNWQQKDDNVNYPLTKELINIYNDAGYTFNKNNFEKVLMRFDLKDEGIKQDITDMDAIAFRLLEEKNTRKLSPVVIKNLTAFDNYIYSLGQ